MLGLEAVLAFGFGAVFFKEGYALTKVAGAALVLVGVRFLRACLVLRVYKQSGHVGCYTNPK